MPTGRPRSPALRARGPGARRPGPAVTPADSDAVGAAAGGRLVDRRTVLRTGLLAGAASVLPGCGLLDGDVVPFGPEEPPPDTSDLAAALADEERLLAAHLAAVERHPGLAPRLVGVRADHEQHRRVLRALLVELDPEGPWASPASVPGGPSAGSSAGTVAPTPAGTPGTRSTATAGSTPAGTPSAGRPTAPAVPAEALATLVELERTASSARTEQAVTAGRSWAPLLGVLAASEAAHAAVLGA